VIYLLTVLDFRMDFDGNVFIVLNTGTITQNLPGSWSVPKHYVGTIRLTLVSANAGSFGNAVATFNGFDQVFTFPVRANGSTVNNPVTVEWQFNNYITDLPTLTFQTLAFSPAADNNWYVYLYVNKNA